MEVKHTIPRGVITYTFQGDTQQTMAVEEEEGKDRY